MAVYRFHNKIPKYADSVFLAPNAIVIGDVEIGEASSIWFGSVVRGDTAPIRIGCQTNIQDQAVLHADPGKPLTIGDRVTVAHNCVVHGCQIEDDCLIGIGAVVMNGALIGQGSTVAAGAVILENTSIPPGSLVTGVPGKVKRALGAEARDMARLTATYYSAHAKEYASVETFQPILPQTP
jgi:carbonic anhydrase/acetyltransferase-like protein (isoleucine patch superfamily)